MDDRLFTSQVQFVIGRLLNTHIRTTGAIYNTRSNTFVAWTGVLGAYAYWGPKAGAQVFSMTPQGADLKFGAITVVTGVIGTILGGVALDRVGSTMTNALAICCISNGLG